MRPCGIIRSTLYGFQAWDIHTLHAYGVLSRVSLFMWIETIILSVRKDDHVIIHLKSHGNASCHNRSDDIILYFQYSRIKFFCNERSDVSWFSIRIYKYSWLVNGCKKCIKRGAYKVTAKRVASIANDYALATRSRGLCQSAFESRRIGTPIPHLIFWF